MLSWTARAATNDTPHVYPSGFSIALKLGGTLFEALPPEWQQIVSPAPVVLDMSDTPMVAPVAQKDDDKTTRQVSASLGFIDLLNHVAHAKAIDRIEPGYFQKYVLNLSRTDTNGAVPEVPNISDNRYWTESVMNDQLSFFNQMFGLTIAINLSHHYLGVYDRYATQLSGAKPTPINKLLTPEEWKAAFRAGALNSLNCALGVDGVHALLDAFDKMPARPPWTTFIVPANASIRQLNADLTQYEADFFHGKFH
ncbi:MAG TPA: hypothetical protein VHB20_12100 [Verrucomicrobiae bacterium]|jgi:hypothetical protein|nr:hypothetical protein [Verrucomicrobiae bacterium]